MIHRIGVTTAVAAIAAVVLAGCGGVGERALPTVAVPAAAVAKGPVALPSEATPAAAGVSAMSVPATDSAAATSSAAGATPEPGVAVLGPPVAPPGNPDGAGDVPPGAEPVNTSRPDRVIGDGSPESCTSSAVVEAVALGGLIAFACGPIPVTIPMEATAKVVNGASPTVVIDGGGLVTLSGQGRRRILYMNTCDEAQGWTTSHCDDQDHPRLTVQNIGFTAGDSTGTEGDTGTDGGGAIFVRGGRLTVIGSTFTDNRCDETGPDVGGAAIRVLDQFQDQPVTVANSTFTGGVCSNGGALSSIGVSWVVVDSVLSGNKAVGSGANPARSGTAGGGSGGAIYADGNQFSVTLSGTRIEDNQANEGGAAVFFVSNDRTGTMRIEDSTLRGNVNDGFETDGFPGIFFLGAAPPTVTGSTLTT